MINISWKNFVKAKSLYTYIENKWMKGKTKKKINNIKNAT